MRTMRSPRVFAALVAGSVFCAISCADIAPTEYIASGIALKSDSTVQMQRAKVEIAWAAPTSLAPACSMTAAFTMVNRTPDPQKLMVGFPLPYTWMANDTVTAPMTIAFDHQIVPMTPPPRSPQEVDDGNWIWYSCQHSFKPGTTEVAVKTAMRASLVYCTPYHESLYYCIQTGGSWAGNIGEEEVVIRFPYPVDKDQISAASPDGYQIDGNCVRWRFTDFKPKGKEFDINLTYVRPDVMCVIAALRQEARHAPTSSSTAVKLARHLLALGYGKSNSGYPPSTLTKEQHETIMAGIKSTEDRKIFTDHYKTGSDGRYAETSSEWTEHRTALIQILADAGYRTEDSKRRFVREGENLLHGVLQHDPHNAEAWNIYLANYWRFSFAAVGHPFGPTRLSRQQIHTIESAAANCPTDPAIQAWLEYCHEAPGKRNERGLMETIRSRRPPKLDFPKMEYGY